MTTGGLDPVKKSKKLEEIKMTQISLNRIISGYNLTWGERVEYFALIKEFLLSTCRKNSRVYVAVENAWFENMESCGIFDRLCVINGRAQYIAGQDYTGEIQTVKKYFIK